MLNSPKQFVTLDFEAYFDSKYTLSRLSIMEYVEDRRFEFTGLGIQEFTEDEKGPIKFYRKGELSTAIKQLQLAYGDNLERCSLVVQNCFFDCVVLYNKFNILPKNIVDTKWLANYLDSRSSSKLEDLARRYKLSQPKGNTAVFKGLHADEAIEAGIEDYCKNDVKLETELALKLLPLLNNKETELELMQHTFRIYGCPTLKFDFSKAKKLIIKMNYEKQIAVDKTGYNSKQLSGNISFARILKDKLGDDMPLKTGKPTKNMRKITGAGFIPAVAKNDEGTHYLLTHPDIEIKNLIKARLGIKSWTGHIKRIYSMIGQARACKGRLPIPLNYYGGRTGRWSGAQGINPQNLGGKGRGSSLNPLIAEVRGLLKAPMGYKLIISDLAQIEARVLAFLADEQQLVKGFANKEDVYSTFASELFGVKVYKNSGDKDLDIKRGFGKDAILGAGYGLGIKTFYTRCLQNENLRPLFESGEYNISFIRRLINTYRNKHKMIVKFWGVCEKAFKWVIKYPHTVVNLKNKGCPVDIIFSAEGKNVYVQLPSGRVLNYYRCSLENNSIKEKYGWLWGGSIVENLVQAISRDILAEHILAVDKTYPVILHIHDELIALAKNEIAENVALPAVLEIMRTPPDWINGLVIDAEGSVNERYCK